MSANPRDGFRSFLDKAESDGWIAGYKWVCSEHFGQLRDKLGGIGPVEEKSRSHKKGTDGLWWGVEVEAHYGTSVGVDLEFLMQRPILDDPTWITTRLGIARNTQPKNILEEWSSRESAFKALAPNNQKILISQFRRSAPGTLTVYTAEGERNVQLRSAWSGRWVLTLAWRTL